MQKINFKIAPMSKKDVPTVAELEQLYFSKPWSENAILSELDNPDAYFVVSKSGEIIVGYAGIYYVCDEGYIYTIAVHHDFRNMKIGQNLLAELESYAKNKNLKFISLEVRESNKVAIGLYKTYGFEIAGLRKNFYSFPQENGIIMTKYIDV